MAGPGRPPKKPMERRSELVATKVKPQTLRKIEQFAKAREWSVSFAAAQLIERGLQAGEAK